MAITTYNQRNTSNIQQAFGSFPSKWFLLPTGGNQREVDRMRSEARHAKKGVGERKEGNPQSRNENDAARLAAKIAAKKAAAEANGGEAPGKKKGKK
ncbi:hypothetical protein JH06_3021 [Blastocystis sp. subtype 4]|uniref:hypothetical protein n=1 Tax=Blastocystis sp. subtype 4 TaxID=944170 RepID=UPI00071226E9|nr:hypothetical protein JH06_3021 [Blastocystis sp. subtype 4]KNB43272.1 hypothetical protein JH06_3021 [Blastocystis sp. subtype 4]|eukprot:XP_014526715.1 hypothetical protein JH06_3021 [Blastocystis sp. subtype 4]